MKTYTSACAEARQAGAAEVVRELDRIDDERVGRVVASGGRLSDLRALGWRYEPERLAWVVEVDPSVPYVEDAIEGAGAREARWLRALAVRCGHAKVGDLHADPEAEAKVAAALGAQ